MIADSLPKKCTVVVEKLLNEMLPRETQVMPDLTRWSEVATTVPLPIPVWAGYRYTGAVADLIRAAKFDGRTDVLELLVSSCPAELTSRSILVPVPQSRVSFVRRGYNQSLIIANCLARLGGGRVCQLLTHNGRSTMQHLLKQTERTKRANPYLINRRMLYQLQAVQMTELILVDDVITTGSTMANCLVTLRLARLNPIAAVVLAATPKKAAKQS